MPVNYLEYKVYSINYNEFYNKFMEITFLDNVELQSVLLKLWIEQLKQADEIEVEQFKGKNLKKMMLKEDLEAPEKYMLDIIYNFGTISIFFRVSRLLQLINSKLNINSMHHVIPMSDFTRTNSYIKWDIVNHIGKIKNNPILLAPLTIGRYEKFVVIDGNHRLTEWKSRGMENVPCYILDGQGLIDNNMFCSNFSRLMYIFQNEIVALGTYTQRDHITSHLLINKIFFRTGKLLYNV